MDNFIPLVSGMKGVTPQPVSLPAWFGYYGATVRDRGVWRNQLGQAVLLTERRARVSTWPPLRLARLRCERKSVVVETAR